MIQYKFEERAKHLVIDTIKEMFSEDYDISEINMVWYAHILGFKKAILIDNGINKRMYEVTYNINTNEMYIDVYEKLRNSVLKGVSG